MSIEYWPSAAFASMRAPWWKLALARTFGKKVVGHDAGCTVTGYRWRGVLYLTGCSRDDIEQLPK